MNYFLEEIENTGGEIVDGDGKVTLFVKGGKVECAFTTANMIYDDCRKVQDIPIKTWQNSIKYWNDEAYLAQGENIKLRHKIDRFKNSIFYSLYKLFNRE